MAGPSTPAWRGGRQRKVAGLITMLAVGVGVALTKAELDRRRARVRQARSRRFSLDRAERLHAGLSRMALGQLDLAIESLQNPAAADPERTIHEIRKAIKRLRALLRLSRGALGERGFQRENRILRDCARRLSGARDAEVMLGVLRTLIKRHPKRLRGRASVGRLRRRLEAERAQSLGEESHLGDIRAQTLAELCAMRERVASWALPDSGFPLIAQELRDIYREGRRSLRQARKASDTATWHEWRKRAKDLRYVAQMLDRGRGTDARAGRMRRVESRADRLGELLGEERDLKLLEGRIKRHSDVFEGDRRTRRLLRKQIDKRRRRLRREALALGGRLYRDSPRRFVHRARASLTDV
jgi:CHAD domain-containing protein